ncbi:MAG TPA: NAD(P)H-binding protein [Anaerolineaceae bacterium]|nr:NAD(P)H-binding protein [Anaerolineaceae bacterium]
MILVTGGTGFIGRSLIQALVSSGEQVRVLLRPSKTSPNFPKGISVEVAVSSFSDQRSLRAALKGVDFLYHFAGAERQGLNANLNQIDVEGTATLMRAAKDTNLKRVFYLSHHGADRGSAYPVMKAKGIAENWIMDSGIPYTILRTGAVFGPGDQFTIPLTRLLRISPYFTLMPGDGSNLLQPIWIEDLVTCILLAAADDKKRNRVIPVGGIEYLTYLEILKLVMKQTGIQRKPLGVTPEFLRGLTLWIAQVYPKLPVSIFWLDYLAVDRITSLDSVPREFGLIPARFKNKIDYLNKKI